MSELEGNKCNDTKPSAGDAQVICEHGKEGFSPKIILYTGV